MLVCSASGYLVDLSALLGESFLMGEGWVQVEVSRWGPFCGLGDQVQFCSGLVETFFQIPVCFAVFVYVVEA